MNLTKGKLTKIMNKRKQSMRRYKKQRKYRRASKTFRRRKPLNLHRSSMKKMYNHDKLAWIGGEKDANGVDWTRGVDSSGRPQWRQSGTSVRTYVNPFTSSESPDEKVPGIVKSAEDAPLAVDADAANVADAADAAEAVEPAAAADPVAAAAAAAADPAAVADPVADPATDPVASNTEVPVAYTKTFDNDPTDVPVTTATDVPVTTANDVPVTTATEVPAASAPLAPLTTATEVPITTATEVPITTATEVPITTAEAESSTKQTMEEAFKVITDGIANAVVAKLQNNESSGLQNNPTDEDLDASIVKPYNHVNCCIIIYIIQILAERLAWLHKRQVFDHFIVICGNFEGLIVSLHIYRIPIVQLVHTIFGGAAASVSRDGQLDTIVLVAHGVILPFVA
jgi:hypothetical protein